MPSSAAIGSTKPSAGPEPSPEHVAGGLVALNQAEATFQTIPLYNAQLEIQALQKKLDDAAYSCTTRGSRRNSNS